jgi:hypothetical protein
MGSFAHAPRGQPLTAERRKEPFPPSARNEQVRFRAQVRTRMMDWAVNVAKRSLRGSFYPGRRLVKFRVDPKIREQNDSYGSPFLSPAACDKVVNRASRTPERLFDKE